MVACPARAEARSGRSQENATRAATSSAPNGRALILVEKVLAHSAPCCGSGLFTGAFEASVAKWLVTALLPALLKTAGRRAPVASALPQSSRQAAVAWTTAGSGRPGTMANIRAVSRALRRTVG